MICSLPRLINATLGSHAPGLVQMCRAPRGATSYQSHALPCCTARSIRRDMKRPILLSRVSVDLIEATRRWVLDSRVHLKHDVGWRSVVRSVFPLAWEKEPSIATRSASPALYYCNILCYVMTCYVMLCYAMLYYTTLYDIVLYHIISYYVIRYITYYIISYHIISYHIIIYHIILCSSLVYYSIVSYNMI